MRGEKLNCFMTIVYCFDEEFYIYRDLFLTSAMLSAVAFYCGKEIGSEVYGDDTVPSVCMSGYNHDAIQLKLLISACTPNPLYSWC